jgi:hypothetical protein
LLLCYFLFSVALRATLIARVCACDLTAFVCAPQDGHGPEEIWAVLSEARAQGLARDVDTLALNHRRPLPFTSTVRAEAMNGFTLGLVGRDGVNAAHTERSAAQFMAAHIVHVCPTLLQLMFYAHRAAQGAPAATATSEDGARGSSWRGAGIPAVGSTRWRALQRMGAAAGGMAGAWGENGGGEGCVAPLRGHSVACGHKSALATKCMRYRGALGQLSIISRSRDQCVGQCHEEFTGYLDRRTSMSVLMTVPAGCCLMRTLALWSVYGRSGGRYGRRPSISN